MLGKFSYGWGLFLGKTLSNEIPLTFNKKSFTELEMKQMPVGEVKASALAPFDI